MSKKLTSILLVAALILNAGTFAFFYKTNSDLKATVSRDRQTAEQEIERLDAELEKTNGDLVSTNTQIAGLETELSSAKDALAAANGEIETLSGDLAGTKSDLDTANGEIGNLKSQLEGAQTELASTRNELSVAHNDIADLNKTLAETNSALTTANENIADLSAQLDGTKEDLAVANNTIGTLSENLAETKATLEAANSEIESLTSQLEGTKAELASTEDELDTAKGDIADLNKALADTNTDLAAAKAELEETNGMLEALSEEAKVLRDQASELFYKAGIDILDSDPTKAEGLLSIAFDSGHIDAAFVLGEEYLSGENFEQNTDKAIKCLAFAAEEGSVPALMALGSAYETAEYGMQDMRKAIAYYKQVIESGEGEVTAQAETAVADMQMYLDANDRSNEGEYEAAIALFESLGDKYDSQTRVREVKYAYAGKLAVTGQQEKAKGLYQEIRGYHDVDTILADEDYWGISATVYSTIEDEYGNVLRLSDECDIYPMDLEVGQQACITMRLENETEHDILVEVKTNNGATWERVLLKAGDIHGFTYVICNYDDSFPESFTDSIQWFVNGKEKLEIDLSVITSEKSDHRKAGEEIKKKCSVDMQLVVMNESYEILNKELYANTLKWNEFITIVETITNNSGEDIDIGYDELVLVVDGIASYGGNTTIYAEESYTLYLAESNAKSLKTVGSHSCKQYFRGVLIAEYTFEIESDDSAVEVDFVTQLMEEIGKLKQDYSMVVADYNGGDVTLMEVTGAYTTSYSQILYYYYYYYGSVSSVDEGTIAAIKEEVLQDRVETEICLIKAGERGITLTAEEEADCDAKAAETWKRYYETYYDSYAKGETEQERDVSAVYLLLEEGTTPDILRAQYRENAIIEKLKFELYEEAPVPAEAEADEDYEEYVESCRKEYYDTTVAEWVLQADPHYYYERWTTSNW